MEETEKKINLEEVRNQVTEWVLEEIKSQKLTPVITIGFTDDETGTPKYIIADFPPMKPSSDITKFNATTLISCRSACNRLAEEIDTLLLLRQTKTNNISLTTAHTLNQLLQSLSEQDDDPVDDQQE